LDTFITNYGTNSGTWNDLSENGNNATLINTPTYGTSNDGYLIFNGSNQYATIPHSSAMNLIDNHSISVWFYQTSSTASSVALFGKGTNDGDEQYCLLIDSARTSIYYDIGGGGPYMQPTISTLSLNTWYHLIVTQSRVSSTSTMSLFINGVKQSTTTISPTSTPNTNSSNFTIGVARGTSFPFPGRIANFQMHNVTITPAQALYMYDKTKSRFGL
jgi:hypothetical protein